MQPAIGNFIRNVEEKLEPRTRTVGTHLGILVAITAFFGYGAFQAQSPGAWCVVAFIVAGLWCSIIAHFSHRWDILPVTKRLAHVLQEGCFIHIGRMHPSPNVIFTAMASHDEQVTHGFIGSLRHEDLARIAPELRELEEEYPDQIFWVK
jgi:hypothetical protein